MKMIHDSKVYESKNGEERGRKSERKSEKENWRVKSEKENWRVKSEKENWRVGCGREKVLSELLLLLLKEMMKVRDDVT